MRKISRKKAVREEGRGTLVLGLAELVRRDLREFVIDAGMCALAAMLERDRDRQCGPRYQHQAVRAAHRGGHVNGSLVMGGRRVTVRRPRVQAEGGGELTLPTWDALSCEDPLNERAVEQMLVGVSTRKYARSLEPVPAAIVTRGTSKSAVSRRFVAATKRQMGELLSRDLTQLDLVALMIDGVYIDEHVVLVALGIEASGKKHVLGVREGATENAASCKELLADLVDRGVAADRSILAVIDGGKALVKALRAVFGGYVVIQRCQAHKVRNVVDQLPEHARDTVRAAMRQAYRAGDPKTAKRLLNNLERQLRDEHPGAAASLAEGLDETLTVKQFRLPEWAERTLSTTNAIENVMGSVRQTNGRVKRWKNGAMVVRWTVTALLEAERHFRRLRDYAGIKKLDAALRARDAAKTPVESQEKVA